MTLEQSRTKRYPAIRTTMDKFGIDILPNAGIYILAYMGRIVYVGRTIDSIEHRLRIHVYSAEKKEEQLGRWLIINADHENIRLDCLDIPDDVDDMGWLKEVEEKCIKVFKPLFNSQLNETRIDEGSFKRSDTWPEDLDSLLFKVDQLNRHVQEVYDGIFRRDQ